MEFLKDFGFDPILLVAQIINFLVILFLLKKLMYKPVLEMLKKRDSEIKKGLYDKEEAEILLTKAAEKETQIIKKAQERADKIVNDAKNEANEVRGKIEESARRDSERMLEQARSTIASETKETEDRLTKKIGEISIALLESALKGIFGEKEQKEILKKASTQIQKGS